MRSLITAIIVLTLSSCGHSPAIIRPPVLPTVAPIAALKEAPPAVAPECCEVATSVLDRVAAEDFAKDPIVLNPVQANVKLPRGWKQVAQTISEDGSLAIEVANKALAATGFIVVSRKNDNAKSPFSACNYRVRELVEAREGYSLVHDNYNTDGSYCQTDMMSGFDRLSFSVQNVADHRDLLLTVSIIFPRQHSFDRLAKELAALAKNVTIAP